MSARSPRSERRSDGKLPRSPWSARRTSVVLAPLLTLLRVLAAISVFQLSGAAHLAADLVDLVTIGHHADETEHERDPDHDCPPGCPTCHHVHYSAASLPPAAPWVLDWVLRIDGRTVTRPPGDGGPRRAAHDSLYRPPRIEPRPLGRGGAGSRASSPSRSA